MNRVFPHPGLSAILFVVWMLLKNTLTVADMVGGVVIAILLPIVTAPFWPRRPLVRFGRGAGFVVVVLWDIIVANLEVAWIIVTRRNADLRPAWLVIPLDLETPEAITVLAATISLTPGTLSADVSACGRYLLVHALDTADPDGDIARIKRRYEARLAKVFR